MIRRMVIMLALVVVIALLFLGAGAFRDMIMGKIFASFATQKQTVATVTAATTPWQDQLQAVGTLRAIQGANLSAEVAGIVDSIHFDSGQDVAAGTTLLTLRPNNDNAVLAQLQATADLARVTLARDQRQLAANAVSQQTVDSDRANLESATAQVASQQALMAEKIVKAPFAGRLGIRQVDLGQYLTAGTEIVTLQQLDPLYADFYVPQQALARLTVGQTVEVSVDAFPGRVFTGKVEAIDSAIDTASRNVQVRARIDNPGEILRPGMFATVAIDIGAPHDLITLPQTAVSYNPYGDTVFVVKHQGADLIAQQNFVTLGAARGDQVAILKGIAAGDIVVSAGALKLHNGSLIAIDNTLQPSDNPNPSPPNE